METSRSFADGPYDTMDRIRENLAIERPILIQDVGDLAANLRLFDSVLRAEYRLGGMESSRQRRHSPKRGPVSSVGSGEGSAAGIVEAATGGA